LPHLLDASGNPIRHGRPSPRTQGVYEEGETFQKFGTQQLKFIDPAKPALGVTQVDTGKQFKGFTTSGYTGTKKDLLRLDILELKRLYSLRDFKLELLEQFQLSCMMKL